jgi:ubiquinone/menaquinone biosynthesis C-methylase UbiE
MLDWGAGSYERTAAELEPVSSRVVQELAGPLGGAAVLDVACGTGNAALLAAAAGARVAAVDAAPRLLEVARRRAKDASLNVDFRLGDMLALPVADHDADLVVSVFGVIFAPDPTRPAPWPRSRGCCALVAGH